MALLPLLLNKTEEKWKAKIPCPSTDGSKVGIIGHTEFEESLACIQQPLDISQEKTGLIVKKMNKYKRKLEVVSFKSESESWGKIRKCKLSF